jgi:hypothetical protein
MRHLDLDALFEECLNDTREALRAGDIHDYKANIDAMEIYIKSYAGAPYLLAWSADHYMTPTNNYPE